MIRRTSGGKMLRALSLVALVLLCSATSLLAQERHIATYGGGSGSLGPQWLAGGRRKFEKYGTQIEWVLMTGGGRGIQAMLGGGTPYYTRGPVGALSGSL